MLARIKVAIATTRRRYSESTSSLGRIWESEELGTKGGCCSAGGVGGTPACGAGWYILPDVNGLPQPSHPRRAQNQGAYPTPSMVARATTTDLYAAAAPRRRGPRGGIWSTPEPPPMGAPTVRLTPRGHGRPLRPPERAAVRRKLGLRGLRSRPARTCLVLKPAKRLAIRPKASASGK